MMAQLASAQFGLHADNRCAARLLGWLELPISNRDAVTSSMPRGRDFEHAYQGAQSTWSAPLFIEINKVPCQFASLPRSGLPSK